MARINVDQQALTDARFARLAELRGWADADHARGKMLRIWNECIHRGPELEVWLIDHHLGAGGAGDLLDAQLATLVRLAGEVAGVPAGGTLVRIKGTDGRTDYLEKVRKRTQVAGKARAATAQRVAGRFASNGHEQDAGGGVTSKTSAPAPAPDPAPEEKNSGAPAEPPPTFALTGERPKPKAPKHPQLDPTTDHSRAIAAFDVAYSKAYGAKPTWDGKSGALISKLLKAHGLAEVLRRIDVLFTSPPAWLTPPFDVATLAQHFDKLVVTAPAAPSKPKIASIPIASSSRGNP